MEAAAQEIAKEVPTVKNKAMKTLTMCARAHTMFPDLLALAQPGPEPVRLLVLGPGNDKGFVPEYLELEAIFWNREAEMIVVDHNEEVIQAIKNCKVYPLPTLKQLGIGAAAEDRLNSLQCIKDIGTVANPEKPNEYHLALPNSKHKVDLFQGDFTAFDYGENKFDAIVALNSIFYLLNNPAFTPFCYPYLKKLVASLKVGGKLFIDKITYDILRDFKAQGVDNVELTNLGVFPNPTYRFQRTH